MNDTWNPWHGCRKISDGCKNCYVYRRDAQYDIDSTAVVKNKTFYAPAERYKYGNYKMVPDGNIIYTCFTSDFFLDEADKWRDECWQMIRQRPEVTFRANNRFDRYVVGIKGGLQDDLYLMRMGYMGTDEFLGVRPLGFHPVPGQWYKLKVEVCGSRIRVVDVPGFWHSEP